MRLFIIAIILILVSVPPTISTAQDQSAPSEGASIQQPAEEKNSPLAFDENRYVDPTYPNLAHLYWALSILDLNQNILIDNFMAITECNMYKSYYNNDIEWKEIREATRAYLRNNYKVFPTHFKITIPLFLGRYNAEEEYFEVDKDASIIDSVRNIETVYNTKPLTCGISRNLEGYPKNLVLYLNRPFSLSRLPVEKELARLFLDEVSHKGAQKVLSSSGRLLGAGDSVRTAYLQFMFRVHSYKGNINTVGGQTKAVVYAQIDHIKVFADYEGEKLLYQKDMHEEDNRKRRKRVGPITGDDLKLPEGPIFGDVEPKKK